MPLCRRPERAAMLSLMFVSIVIAFFMILGIWATQAHAKHDLPEKAYQTFWCENQGWRLEVIWKDGARVDLFDGGGIEK